MTSKPVIQAPWSIASLAAALGRTPESIRTALCRGKFPIPTKRILGRVYFSAEDVAWLLEGPQDMLEERVLPPAEERTDLENLALDHLTRQGVHISVDVYEAIRTLFSSTLLSDETALEAKTIFAVEMVDAALRFGRNAEGQHLKVAPHIVNSFAEAAVRLEELVAGVGNAQ